MADHIEPGTDQWLALIQEPIIDPDRHIIDPHHHLWESQEENGELWPAYLLDHYLNDSASGHNVTKSVYVECGQYGNEGPEHLRPVQETITTRQNADRSKSGPGPEIAGIVAFADLTSGDHLGETLDRHADAADGLFCGIRHSAASAEHPQYLTIPGDAPIGLMADSAYRQGAILLGDRGLPLDCWHYHYQNKAFLELARAVPDTVFILDHFGTPLGSVPYAAERDAIMAQWTQDITEIARCENVIAKLGGLAMPDNGFGWDKAAKPPTSDEIVTAQRDVYLHTIDCFGPERCMFESNFPVDRASLSYPVLYNAFKKMVADFSEAEKDAMFSGTAARVYKLD